MALASTHVSSTAVGANEFSELAGQYDVYSVPKIVINDHFAFTGGLPEMQFVDAVLSVLTQDGEE